MNLESDEEQRCWFVKGEQSAVAWSQVWGYYHEKDHDEANQGAGERFQAPLGFVVSLLRKLGMDLIVEVEIERNYQRFHWEDRNNDDFGYILPSTRLFLIKPDDSINTL